MTDEPFNGIRTPFWLYDLPLLRRTLAECQLHARRSGVGVRYAIKANNDPRILREISASGMGADCVSGGEILRALDCGFKAMDIVYAGVGKTDEEILLAMRAGIGAFNVESTQELAIIEELAGREGLRARVALRLNPDIDAHTHRYITTGLEENKFGISSWEFDRAASMVRSSRNLDFVGLHFHIGSQITSVERIFALECRKVSSIVRDFESKGLEVGCIDLGGGLGIDYYDPDTNPVPDFASWMKAIDENLERRDGQRVLIEPGRAIVAQCGSLMTRVIYVKEGRDKSIVVTDAGMNNLIRPALYGAYHRIDNVSEAGKRRTRKYDVVGPVCESSDVWAEGRKLPATSRGDLLALRSAGAYGQTMSSNYNMRGEAGVQYIEQ